MLLYCPNWTQLRIWAKTARRKTKDHHAWQGPFLLHTKTPEVVSVKHQCTDPTHKDLDFADLWFFSLKFFLNYFEKFFKYFQYVTKAEGTSLKRPSPSPVPIHGGRKTDDWRAGTGRSVEACSSGDSKNPKLNILNVMKLPSPKACRPYCSLGWAKTCWVLSKGWFHSSPSKLRLRWMGNYKVYFCFYF